MFEEIEMTDPITNIKIDNRKLKAYGLKLGDWVFTDESEGSCIGLIIVESHVDSFELNKGEKRHLIQVQIDEDTIIGQDIYETDFFIKLQRVLETKL